MNERKNPNAINPDLKISFGGLISFVEEEKEDGKTVHALMVEPNNSEVSPSLCRHHRYLVVSARHVSIPGGDSDFLTKLIGRDTEGRIDTLVLWDIDGCDIDLLPEGELDPKLDPIKFCKKNVLDLSQFDGGGPVDPTWIQGDLKMYPGLVRSRLRLHYGVLRGGKVIRESWMMCPEEEQCEHRMPPFSETLEYEIHGGNKIFKLRARNLKLGKEQSIYVTCQNDNGQPQSADPPYISISNLCPGLVQGLTKERDVLAYYELVARDRMVDQSQRKIPWVGPRAEPRLSSCPPVTQPIAGGGR